MAVNSSGAALHNFAALHLDENCAGVTGHHENELFFNCTFDKLTGLTLKDCDLNHSRFVTSDVRDALGFTLTLDCNSFQNVEFSPLLFDLLLMLLSKSKGNDEKRRQLLAVVGPERAGQLQRLLRVLER